MSKPVFKFYPGYSSVDHVGLELAGYATDEIGPQAYTTRAGAVKGGERALNRVKRWLRASSEGVWKHFLPRINVTAQEI